MSYEKEIEQLVKEFNRRFEEYTKMPLEICGKDGKSSIVLHELTSDMNKKVREIRQKYNIEDSQ